LANAPPEESDMSENRRHRDNKNHTRGQEHGRGNKYRPPVPIGVLDELIRPNSTLKEWRRINRPYDKGWRNGYKNR
jgi:hypothetical protein